MLLLEKGSQGLLRAQWGPCPARYLSLPSEKLDKYAQLLSFFFCELIRTAEGLADRCAGANASTDWQTKPWRLRWLELGVNISQKFRAGGGNSVTSLLENTALDLCRLVRCDLGNSAK
jgi:hypothetical protein